ncbi:hypothetical protein F5884DRAFT_226516 [Xylogone sp. PMI_703]|nr:hypothetical protein F5884DRAFT_226516 [Xylogone sp. PMI_703]
MTHDTPSTVQTPFLPCSDPESSTPSVLRSWRHAPRDDVQIGTLDRMSSSAESSVDHNLTPHGFSPTYLAANSYHQSPGKTSNTAYLGLQESCLLRCFIENLAEAFDTTDRDRHYVTVVPQRAMYSPLLLNAICTASARYLTQIWSRKRSDQVVEYHGMQLPGLNKESAIHYHNICISYLMDVSANPADSCTDDALTAITILRYHEQVDTHLTGSDSETYLNAVQAVFHTQQDNSFGLLSIICNPPKGSDIYAFSMPSLRHSACLIALRQEIWSVLLYKRPFRLSLYPVDSYADFDMATADVFDWTNHIIVWCAYVLKFCFGGQESNLAVEGGKSRVEHWNALKDFERNWDHCQIPHFKPIYYQERNPLKGEYFPIEWHHSHGQVIGLQHIELARIMLAVHDPSLQRLGIGASASNKALEKLLKRSTRRLCGLALSNKSQPTLVTAAVGISMCGEYFEDPGGQAAIVDLMAALESEHAWPTHTVVDALQNAWSARRPNHD